MSGRLVDDGQATGSYLASWTSGPDALIGGILIKGGVYREIYINNGLPGTRQIVI
ncbi:hypothetical protein [Desulfoscipio gibsoniae]|uniref:hypothetical protein n=1 Tax=Desulfoscipio gibsoniae TaxID=102134 RepID=UPI0002D66A31|nr:hypothetical protein [Desulfoscipio gibsoniae]